MMFESILDFLLGWMTYLHPALALFIFAFIVTLISTLIVKYFSDQKEMKRLKSEMKKLSNEMKQNRTNQKKMMETQKKLFGLQGQYNKHMLKVNFYTILPILILFGWLNAHLAFFPLSPAEPFNMTLIFENNVSSEEVIVEPSEGLSLINISPEYPSKEINYTFKGIEEGNYTVFISFQNQNFSKNIILSERQIYEPPVENIKDSVLKQIKLSNKPMRINLGIKLHWILAYIIFTMILSPILRKILKVY